MKVLAFPSPKHDPSPEPDEVDARAAARTAPALDGEEPKRYDRITLRAISVAIVLSLFVHFAILFLPLINKVDQELKAPADETGPLSVTIAGAKPQPPSPVPQPRQEATPPTPTPPVPTPPVTPRPAPKAKPTPARPRSQIAVNSSRTPPLYVPPATAVQPPTPEVAPAPTPPQPITPTTDDFSERLAQRQAERRAQNGGAPDSVLESDDQRANRIAKANIAAQARSSSPGQDMSEGGGIFELKHTGLNEAEFVFNGWNRDFRRKLGKTYEVKIGNNPDIQTAVVRQMIEIIREVQPGDFQWYSYRLKGKSITLSARPKDQAELEAFLLKEFYEGQMRPSAPKR